MKSFSESLLSDLNRQLERIHSETSDPIMYSERCIKILIPTLEQLKTFLLKHKFENKSGEIHFFREIKPQFASKLIYYNELYNIISSQPIGSKRMLRKFYAGELKKLDAFFDDNAEFYKYYRTGNRYLDIKYFIRGKHDIRLSLDSFYLQAHSPFSTSHDFKVAKILANERLCKFLESELTILNTKSHIPAKPKQNNIRWTGSKVALTELIYALHAEAVFNQGNTGLKETFRHFENMFNVDLGQFNRTFLEIRERKSERTKFLSALTNTLILRMDDVNEN